MLRTTRILASAGRAVVALMAGLVLTTVISAAAKERVYLTKEEALAKVLPKDCEIRERVISIDSEEIHDLEERLGIEVLANEYVFYEAVQDHAAPVRAVIMNVIGQHQPITFVVAIGDPGEIRHVEIMVYREPRGGEVRRRAFLKQYESKSLEDPLRLHDDVTNITGATLSSRHVSEGVRLALILNRRLDAGQ